MNKSIQVDGLKIHYLEEGTGPEIVLIHGASLGSSADVWEQSLGVLAQGGFRVLAYDQPGFGDSDNPNDYTIAYRTDFILKFMDALGISQTCLVGHSQSGGMVVRLALEHQDRVSSIVVIGTGSLLPSLPGQSRKGQVLEGEEGGQSSPTFDDTKTLLENNFFNKSLITPEVVEKRHRLSVGKNFEAFLERSKAKSKSLKDAVPLRQRLKDVPVPLLMLYGARDRGSAANRCALLKEKEPDLKVELVENAGHLLMWEAQEIFIQKMLDFLSG